MIKAILIGSGARGADAYAPYALTHSDDLKFIAVAEPIEERRLSFKKAHNIEDDKVFKDYKELFNHTIEADCVFVCTQDQDHFAPVMLALEKGYHVLCEKPMSGSLAECEAMVKASLKYNKTLAVCHVLRYTPFFLKVKSLIEEGALGRVISINLTENVAFCHYAHSFVRGSWRNSKLSNPMILAKSCHDMDMLQYLAASKCESLSSFGSLTYFKAENAPKGAPLYCLEGCPEEKTCPFYAPHLYLEKSRLTEREFRTIVSTEKDDGKFREILKTSPYGRCVFHCDNDVVDNQVVSMKFENGITANFAMEACTGKWGRTLAIMGSRGQLIADTDEKTITFYDFLSDTKQAIEVEEETSGHLGGDLAIVEDFVRVLSSKGQYKAKTTAKDSLESHIMALAAEDARVTGKVVKLADFTKRL